MYKYESVIHTPASFASRPVSFVCDSGMYVV